MPPSSIEKTTETMHAIVACAARYFNKYGYRKTTVDDIAADAHISKKTLYSVFPSKDAILKEVAWRDTLDIIRTFGDTLPVDTLPDGQLMSLCRYIYTDRIKHGKQGVFKGIHSEDNDIKASYRHALKRVIHEIYDSGRKAGIFKPVDTALATESVTVLVGAALDNFHKTSNPVAIFNDSLYMIADTVAFKDRIRFDRMG